MAASHAVVSNSIPQARKASLDANLDSGCLVSMTPHLSLVTNVQQDRTPVRLSDHSLVRATHKGLLSLPFGGQPTIQTLVVPSLHKLLLSIAGVCDIGLTVVFTSRDCSIFSDVNLEAIGKPVGLGYRKGNLYYLPLELVSNHLSNFSETFKSSLPH